MVTVVQPSRMLKNEDKVHRGKCQVLLLRAQYGQAGKIVLDSQGKQNAAATQLTLAAEVLWLQYFPRVSDGEVTSTLVHRLCAMFRAQMLTFHPLTIFRTNTPL